MLELASAAAAEVEEWLRGEALAASVEERARPLPVTMMREDARIIGGKGSG